MRAEGFEPPSSLEHRHLKPACIPVPPRPRAFSLRSAPASDAVAKIDNMHSRAEVAAVLDLVAEGLTTSEIARRAGIPRSTVKDWLGGRIPSGAWWLPCDAHAFEGLDRAAYAYLLGMYLGDGCISTSKRGVHRLRITLDAVYPGIVGECVAAMSKVTPGRVRVGAKSGERAVEVSNYWNHWPCVFPQHGPGRKHLRPIGLRPWQEEMVSSHVELFIRGSSTATEPGSSPRSAREGTFAMRRGTRSRIGQKTSSDSSLAPAIWPVSIGRAQARTR